MKQYCFAFMVLLMASLVSSNASAITKAQYATKRTLYERGYTLCSVSDCRSLLRNSKAKGLEYTIVSEIIVQKNPSYKWAPHMWYIVVSRLIERHDGFDVAKDLWDKSKDNIRKIHKKKHKAKLDAIDKLLAVAERSSQLDAVTSERDKLKVAKKSAEARIVALKKTQANLLIRLQNAIDGQDEIARELESVSSQLATSEGFRKLLESTLKQKEEDIRRLNRKLRAAESKARRQEKKAYKFQQKTYRLCAKAKKKGMAVEEDEDCQEWLQYCLAEHPRLDPSNWQKLCGDAPKVEPLKNPS